MSSIEPWSSFFKEAGIPSMSAKNYGTIFDDNRITKEMLLDLDKEILREMGIKIMGDVIAILKHAKKVYSEELKKKDSLAVPGKSAAKVSPMTRTPPATPAPPNQSTNDEPIAVKKVESTTITLTPPKEGRQQKKLDTISADVQYTTAAYKSQQQAVAVAAAAAKNTSSGIKLLQAIPPYGSSLHSDKMENTTFVKSPEKPLILEEYTTSTYEERLKKKRTSTHPSIMKTTTTPPNNRSVTTAAANTRVVVLPLEKKPHLNQSVERSKRFLEAAGIIDTAGLFESYSLQASQPKHSVFSRLELPSPNRTTSQSVLKKSPDIKERLGKRISEHMDGSKIGAMASSLYSEVLEEQKSGSIYDRLGPKEDEPKDNSSSSVTERTMVADNISRHSDVHARLKKRGMSLPNTPRGPLGKRLGQHAVFGRLE